MHSVLLSRTVEYIQSKFIRRAQVQLPDFGFFEATIWELDVTSDEVCTCYNSRNLVSWFCKFMRHIFCVDVWVGG